ncbi:MAG: polysaccharide deacetylase family protein, partial [Pseudomonadota bacterium]|nr:polysaccharide deacetylase family protein [Pseudomonadota bacterium]
LMPSITMKRGLSVPAGLQRFGLRRLDGLGRLATSGRMQDRGCCMIFHRAVASAEWAGMANRGFHLDIGYLERLVRYVQASGWDIVSMSEAVRRTAQPGHRRFVNFSLDDCYRDTAELVVPLFMRLGAPITLYVTTGIPDGTMRLRNAGLETILGRAECVADDGFLYVLHNPKQRRAAYAAISRRWERAGGDADYLRFCDRLGEDADRLDAEHRITWTMLERLRDTPGVEIGAHTVSHRRIASLDSRAAQAEIGGSRARLEERLGIPVRHFAFPYGLSADCGPRDFALARDAGFASAATTRKALLRPGADPYSLPRHTINGSHRHLAFAQAHLSGASALGSSVLRRG